LEPEKVDVVILCNVLHEIPPVDWRILLNETIPKLLTDDGYLLVVEDLQINIGELPHPVGFLLLDRVSMGMLLGNDYCTGFVTSTSGVDKYSKRLYVYVIPKTLLSGVTLPNAAKCVIHVKEEALREIKAIRDGNANDSKTG
jgi:hypothetical protein